MLYHEHPILGLIAISQKFHRMVELLALHLLFLLVLTVERRKDYRIKSLSAVSD